MKRGTYRDVLDHGEEFQLRWRDQNIGCYALREHHLCVLFPLDWCLRVTRVQRVESALLKQGLDALLNFAAWYGLIEAGDAKIFNYVGVDDANVDVVDAEQLRVPQQDGLEVGWEQRRAVARLGKWIDVLDLTS